MTDKVFSLAELEDELRRNRYRLGWRSIPERVFVPEGDGWVEAAVSCAITEDYVLGSHHDFEAQGTGSSNLGTEPAIPEELD